VFEAKERINKAHSYNHLLRNCESSGGDEVDSEEAKRLRLAPDYPYEEME